MLGTIESGLPRDHSLLAGLTDAERERILQHAGLRDSATGQILQLATIGEAGTFGEVSFLKGTPCTATIRAAGPVSLVAIDRAPPGPTPGWAYCLAAPAVQFRTRVITVDAGSSMSVLTRNRRPSGDTS